MERCMVRIEGNQDRCLKMWRFQRSALEILSETRYVYDEVIVLIFFLYTFIEFILMLKNTFRVSYTGMHFNPTNPGCCFPRLVTRWFLRDFLSNLTSRSLFNLFVQNCWTEEYLEPLFDWTWVNAIQDSVGIKL